MTAKKKRDVRVVLEHTLRHRSGKDTWRFLRPADLKLLLMIMMLKMANFKVTLSKQGFMSRRMFA